MLAVARGLSDNSQALPFHESHGSISALINALQYSKAYMKGFSIPFTGVEGWAVTRLRVQQQRPDAVHVSGLHHVLSNGVQMLETG